MNELRAIELDEVIDRACAALSRVSGRAFRIERVQSLSQPDRRNLIARAVAHDDAGRVQPVIVKATRSSSYDPTTEKALEASGLVREWVATAYISAVAPGRAHGAALLAGDVEAGILVFEDLGEGLASLVHPLLQGSADEAESALKLYATALGRLHADTVGCCQSHHATYQSIFGSGHMRPPLGWRVEDEAGTIASVLGHAPPAGELEFLSSRLRDPGPWQSLVHGDPCPDNVLLLAGRARLIDYEWARPAHALLDGIYWRMGFPTCWCAGRTPADVCARIDAVYRTELAQSIPIALDETAYRTEAAYMTAIWLFTSLSWRLSQALERDEKWGIWSIRGRLLWYLDAVIAATGDANVLTGINTTARAWRAELCQRWPAATPLGFYPSFMSRTPTASF
jgi:hypothetical protein